MFELASLALGAEASRVGVLSVLVLARVAPLALVAPWLGFRGVAATVRLTLVLALTLALTPLAFAASMPVAPSSLDFAAMFIRETLLGLSFAVAASVPLYALAWLGGLTARTAGTESWTVEGAPLRTLFGAAAVVAFVTVGGHRLAIRALADSLMELPPTDPGLLSVSEIALGVARHVADALTVTLSLFVPVLATLFGFELVAALSDRFGPALAHRLNGAPLRAVLGVAVGLILLAVSLPHLGPSFEDSIDSAAMLLGTSAP